MKRAVVIIPIVICIAVSAAVGYYIGDKQSADSYKPKISKLVKQNHELDTKLMVIDLEKSQLRSDYDNLANQYSQLYGAASSYIQATRYAPKTVIRCNSSSYGMLNSMSTTCY